MSGVTVQVRRLVLTRDAHRCFWCDRYVDTADYSLQHRRARGMGGTSRPESNRPANLVLVCGSATTGCHGHIESHREESRIRGFTIRQTQDPRAVPLEDRYGHWWLLDDLGGRVRLFGPEVNEYRQLAGMVTW